ncbi:hypothetical protein Geob_1648 [Geotalea daltonii FRC-32]|uniref:Lipoprotein n=1 Tax=Geotalea daltonii (strain DSM 22248 / JCM 15807 / FRC-32) TaxID=316067 RepID=B9M625_GEODF|nr:hypothetical protein [Geotalea daltonii]ACM20006.1 hypothetical protein Geob_1648 [Geotalea daltonii FRC-32]
MRKTWQIVKTLILIGTSALILAACGGGGGGSTTPAATTISGTAAAGAPIIGSVTIKDSKGATKTVQIAADGKYTVDVSDMTGPFMVRADGYVGGNEYHLYSAGTAADVGGTINVTPLTDLIVANIANTVAANYFESGNFSNLTATELKTESDALKAKLLPVLQAVGVSDSIDLLRSSFSTDHSGLDAALDIIKVETTDTTTGAATITNLITKQAISSTTTAVLTDTTNVATGMTDIQKISAGFKQFSDLFATSLPSETNATLLGLFDSATFLDQGQNLASFLSEITTDKEMIGISFTNISIQSMDVAKGTATVAFTVLENGKVSLDAPVAFHMIKKADGKWYMQGDQYIVGIDIEPVAEYHVTSTTPQIITGIRFNIEDRGGLNITSAVVKGAGLPVDGVTLINNVAYDQFQIQNPTQSYGNLYPLTDADIAKIADTGEAYTVELYIGTNTTPAATYTEKLVKRPYLSTELTVDNFPKVTSPTATELYALLGSSADINDSVTWTLPSGLTNDWLSVWVGDNAGNTARFEAGLLPAETSRSLVLSPVTSTGQRFTITWGNIWLGAYDSYGRQLGISMNAWQ